MFADRYELRGTLGQGGMGVVYEAVAHGANGFTRRVAVKQLSPAASSDTTFMRLFLDEARTASRLHHGGIVSVLDFGIVDGAPFQVLELIDGADVGAILRRLAARGERIPLEVALYIVASVAHALAYAHGATDDDGRPLGIVHRDVKPGNIFVSWAGDVKLGDFGIALARDRISSRTTGLARGTPVYMPPEQLRGRDVDARTDVFALGCALHAILVGSSPLVSNDVRAALLGDEEIPISSELPEDVRAIVVRSTQKNPSARHGSAREMATALGTALATRLSTDPKSCVLPWLEAVAADWPKPPRSHPGTTLIVAEGQGDGRAFHTIEASRVGGPDFRSVEASRSGTRRDLPLVRPEPSRTTASTFVYGLVAALVVGAVGLTGAFVLRRPADRNADLRADTSVAPIGSAADHAPDASATAAPLASAIEEDASVSLNETEPPTPTPSAIASGPKAVPSPRRVRRVDVEGLTVLVHDGPEMQRLLATRTLPCFKDLPYRPGVGVMAIFDIMPDGRREDFHSSATCHMARGDCRSLKVRPWVPPEIVACVAAEVEKLPLRSIDTSLIARLSVDVMPVW